MLEKMWHRSWYSRRGLSVSRESFAALDDVSFANDLCPKGHDAIRHSCDSRVRSTVRRHGIGLGFRTPPPCSTRTRDHIEYAESVLTVAEACPFARSRSETGRRYSPSFCRRAGLGSKRQQPPVGQPQQQLTTPDSSRRLLIAIASLKAILQAIQRSTRKQCGMADNAKAVNDRQTNGSPQLSSSELYRRRSARSLRASHPRCSRRESERHCPTSHATVLSLGCCATCCDGGEPLCGRSALDCLWRLPPLHGRYRGN